MLEYLLLHVNNIEQQLHPQLEVWDANYIVTLEGRRLTQTFRSTGSAICYTLPVFCISLCIDPHRAYSYSIQGLDGLEYRLSLIDCKISIRGRWPAYLTSYERK
jgi:hypothetical protein